MIGTELGDKSRVEWILRYWNEKTGRSVGVVSQKDFHDGLDAITSATGYVNVFRTRRNAVISLLNEMGHIFSNQVDSLALSIRTWG